MNLLLNFIIILDLLVLLLRKLWYLGRLSRRSLSMLHLLGVLIFRQGLVGIWFLIYASWMVAGADLGWLSHISIAVYIELLIRSRLDVILLVRLVQIILSLHLVLLILLVLLLLLLLLLSSIMGVINMLLRLSTATVHLFADVALVILLGDRNIITTFINMFLRNLVALRLNDVHVSCNIVCLEVILVF